MLFRFPNVLIFVCIWQASKAKEKADDAQQQAGIYYSFLVDLGILLPAVRRGVGGGCLDLVNS